MSATIPGSLNVSNGCIADIAGYAAMECYGVVGMAEVEPLSGAWLLLPGPKLRQGVDVGSEDGKLCVDLHVIVESNVNLASVAKNLTSSVKFVLAEVAQITDATVRVHVEGMKA